MVRWLPIRKWSCLLNKAQTRKFLKSKRRQVTPELRHQAAITAMELLQDNFFFKNSQNIACYLAQDNEFDCSMIMEKILQTQKDCYLPTLAPDAKQLEFALYRHNDPLQPNRYNILEPIQSRKISPEQLDLVLVPLVGFDLKGYRLGMGGGYYDRTFNFLLNKKSNKPILLGLAYEFQQVDTLPHDEWDMQLNGVLTEEKLKIFN